MLLARKANATRQNLHPLRLKPQGAYLAPAYPAPIMAATAVMPLVLPSGRMPPWLLLAILVVTLVHRVFMVMAKNRVWVMATLKTMLLTVPSRMS